jgi:hypothetical protein
MMGGQGMPPGMMGGQQQGGPMMGGMPPGMMGGQGMPPGMMGGPMGGGAPPMGGMAQVTGPPCDVCNEPIVGRLVNAAGKTYHPDHFVCEYCSQPFPGTTVDLSYSRFKVVSFWLVLIRNSTAKPTLWNCTPRYVLYVTMLLEEKLSILQVVNLTILSTLSVFVCLSNFAY